jgi:hypothetical protein
MRYSLINTLVDIMHELLFIRDRQLWFSSVDFDACDADITVLRGRFIFNCLLLVLFGFYIILCFGTIS